MLGGQGADFIWVHQICRFAKMILLDRHGTSYDLASLFRRRCKTLDFRQMEWKNRKRHWHEAASFARNFHFWRRLAELLRFGWERVSCTAPATENASLQIRAPRPRNCDKTFMFCSLLIRCTFSTSQLPGTVCFVHFQFKMCFAPQQRALFQHLNFQKRSDVEVFCAFWLRNLLRATTVCNFDLSSFQMSPRPPLWQAYFSTSGAPEHWKNTLFRDFSTFSRTCSFFLLTPSLLWPSSFFSCLPWLFPPPLFHLSIVSEVCFLNFLRTVPDSEMRSQWT